MRTAGWSIVSVNELGDAKAAVFRDVPAERAPAQSSRDAENYAFEMLCLFVELPCRVFSDCSGAIAIALAPDARAKGARATNAHNWSHFHASFEPGDLEILKTKGHATQHDVDNGFSTFWERRGNDEATSLPSLVLSLR